MLLNTLNTHRLFIFIIHLFPFLIFLLAYFSLLNAIIDNAKIERDFYWMFMIHNLWISKDYGFRKIRMNSHLVLYPEMSMSLCEVNQLKLLSPVIIAILLEHSLSFQMQPCWQRQVLFNFYILLFLLFIRCPGTNQGKHSRTRDGQCWIIKRFKVIWRSRSHIQNGLSCLQYSAVKSNCKT